MRTQLLSLLAGRELSLHSSFYLKRNAFERIKASGKERFYKLALFLHMRDVCSNAIPRDATVYFVLATIGTARMRKFAREAAEDIASQMPQDTVVCFWDAASSFGLQAADALLWAVQRELMGKPIRDHETLVAPMVGTTSMPWGHESR